MKKGKKYILITIVGVLMIVLLVAICAFWPFFDDIMKLRENAQAVIATSGREDFSEIRTSIVYDCNDEILFTYSGEKDLYYVELKDIPQVLQDAFVMMEDKKFYSHNGVDVFAMGRAVIANYQADEIVQGASTITQQLVRNIYLNQDVNWKRKITEIFMAMEIEKKYSKDDILEFYLNNIYFGNGYYGVEAAARGYFDKSVTELSIGECIFLSAIPNNPSLYDPIKYEKNTVARSRIILKVLYDERKIEELDYLLLTGDEKNPFVPGFEYEDSGYKWNTSTADSYVYTYITYCAVRELMKQNGFEFKNNFVNVEEFDSYEAGYEVWYDYYQRELYTGGYHVYTSIDMEKQRTLQGSVDKVIEENDADYIRETTENYEAVKEGEPYNPLQAAAMTIDNETGKVVAVVGGRTEKSNGFGFNRAYQSFRQSGSAIKPLNVYAPYMSMGHSTDEIVFDVYNPNGPRNAGGAYAGEMTLEEAVKKSKNTIAWQIYRYITPEKGTDYLMRMGFKKVYMDRSYMSSALGGFTYGVSVEEMTAGFRTICNDGIYNSPDCIRKISNDELKEIEVCNEDIYVYEENASKLMTSMLQGVIEDGTGKSAKLSVHSAAGKTGTTNSDKDMWFVGYTPYYTTGVWVGYELPKRISMDNGNLACTIWRDYMDLIHVGLNSKYFEEGEYVFPEINTSLTELAALAYEQKEGEPDLKVIWDNDIDIDMMKEGSMSWDTDISAPTYGDVEASLSGDENAPTYGDEAASLHGDENAPTYGDADANIQGDENASTYGDADAY